MCIKCYRVGFFYTQPLDGGATFSEPTLISALQMEGFPRLEEADYPNEAIDGVDDNRL